MFFNQFSAKRFEYCQRIDNYKDFDATKMGNCCPQFRLYHPHLDNPERLFYLTSEIKQIIQGVHLSKESCVQMLYLCEIMDRFPG